MALGAWNDIWIFFWTFNYGEIAENLIKATGHLYLVKSAFPETWGVQQAWKEAEGTCCISPSEGGSQVSLPLQRHPPVTLGWHTLLAKPSLRLPSAGKPARIRKILTTSIYSKDNFSKLERNELLTGIYKLRHLKNGGRGQGWWNMALLM